MTLLRTARREGRKSRRGRWGAGDRVRGGGGRRPAPELVSRIELDLFGDTPGSAE